MAEKDYIPDVLTEDVPLISLLLALHTRLARLEQIHEDSEEGLPTFIGTRPLLEEDYIDAVLYGGVRPEEPGDEESFRDRVLEFGAADPYPGKEDDEDSDLSALLDFLRDYNFIHNADDDDVKYSINYIRDALGA